VLPEARALLMATYAVLWVASSGLTVINELESAPIAQEPESQHASEGVCLSERLWVRFAKRRVRISSPRMELR